MADIFLDSLYDVVKAALIGSDMLIDIGMEKDYTNYALILRLKNWSAMNMLEEAMKTPSQYNGDPNYEFLNLKRDFSEETVDDVPAFEGAVHEFKEEVESTYDDRREEADEAAVDSTDRHDPFARTRFELVDENDFAETNDAVDSNEVSTDPDYPEVRKRSSASFEAEVMEEEPIGPKKRGRKRKVRKNGLTQKKMALLPVKNKPLKKRAPNNRKYMCDVCDHRTDSIRRLQKHKSTHSDEKPVACSLCDFRCKREDLLRNHMTLHTGEKPYKCNFCEFATRLSNNLQTHKAVHHRDQMKVKEFSCRYCDYTYPLKRAVLTHEKQMHGENNRSYSCQECKFKTVNEKRYLNHVKGHQLNTVIPCHVCGKTFVDENDFKYHVKQTHERLKAKKRVPCPDCDRTFNSSAQLLSHSFVHTGRKEFKCRLCGLEFRVYFCQLKHHKRHHPNEPIFRCEICDFSTSDMRENKRHNTSLTHLNNMPAGGSFPELGPSNHPLSLTADAHNLPATLNADISNHSTSLTADAHNHPLPIAADAHNHTLPPTADGSNHPLSLTANTPKHTLPLTTSPVI